MGLFSKKNEVQGLIGLDIGAGGMKLVELIKKDGRHLLSTYGHVSMRNGDSNNEDIFDPKLAGAVLKELAKKADVQQKKINISLPSHAIFHAIITIPQPKKPNEDIKPLIESRVQQLLTEPLDEMILDSTIIDQHLMPKAKVEDKKKKDSKEDLKIEDFVPIGADKEAPKFVRVLVSGSPRDLVDKYVQMTKIAGLELVSLETESFGMIRSLIGNDKSRIMLVDIGQARSNIEIIQEGIPFLHRSIKAGGAELTKAIAKSTGVDIEVAEQIKRDLGNAESEISLGNIPEHIRDVLEPIIHEIRYSLDLYAKQDFHHHESVEKVILTGGSAHIPYLIPLIQDALNLNVYVGNPWARVLTPPPMNSLLAEIGPMYSIATGLAMKN